MRRIWDGTGEAQVGDAYWTKDDGLMVGRPYVRRRAVAALSADRLLPKVVRADTIRKTVDDDAWLVRHHGETVASVCRDVARVAQELDLAYLGAQPPLRSKLAAARGACLTPATLPAALDAVRGLVVIVDGPDVRRAVSFAEAGSLVDAGLVFRCADLGSATDPDVSPCAHYHIERGYYFDRRGLNGYHDPTVNAELDRVLKALRS